MGQGHSDFQIVRGASLRPIKAHRTETLEAIRCITAVSRVTALEVPLHLGHYRLGSMNNPWSSSIQRAMPSPRPTRGVNGSRRATLRGAASGPVAKHRGVV